MSSGVIEVDPGVPETRLSDIPDELLLYIMAFLRIKEILLASRVNRRWHRIANSGTLWRHIDWPFVPASWMVLRAHITPALVSLRLFALPAGDLSPACTPLSHGVLRDIKERCPSFTDLVLWDVMLKSPDDLGLPCLPSNLRTLELYSCKWDREWFEKSLTGAALPHLTHLLVYRCYNFGDSELKLVSTSGLMLKSLKMSVCDKDKLTEHGLMSIANHLPNLETLRLVYMPQLTLPVCQAIGSNLTKLTHLHLGSNVELTGQWVVAITNGTSKLESLILDRCRNITFDLRSGYLRKQDNMRHLDMSQCISLQDRDLKFILPALGSKLTSLELEMCNISDIGLIYVANQCKQLETLKLKEIDNAFTLESCEAIGQCLTNLRRLNLYGNSSLTGPCLAAITRETHLLESLNISDCESIVLDSLGCLGRLTKLRKLMVCNSVGDSEDEIRRAMNLTSVRSSLPEIFINLHKSS